MTKNLENLFGYGRKIKIMKKVLYTNGDSYTFGDELSNPRKSAWPPIHVNPVSNEIRVRADGLAKIMAKD